ncbi:hypothetical protein CAY57_11720 [Heyndrickxia coagulans]|nr:hypothetical protein CAY57_11720 [Heyndrickxia coagulans]
MRFRTACRLFCRPVRAGKPGSRDIFTDVSQLPPFSTSMPLHRETYFVLPRRIPGPGLLF